MTGSPAVGGVTVTVLPELGSTQLPAGAVMVNSEGTYTPVSSSCDCVSAELPQRTMPRIGPALGRSSMRPLPYQDAPLCQREAPAGPLTFTASRRWDDAFSGISLACPPLPLPSSPPLLRPSVLLPSQHVVAMLHQRPQQNQDTQITLCIAQTQCLRVATYRFPI